MGLAKGSPLRTVHVVLALVWVLVFVVLEFVLLGDTKRTAEQARRDLEVRMRQATEAKARDMGQLINDIYVGTRSISLLPAVRTPPPRNRPNVEDDAVDGKRFTVADAQTLTHLYFRLADVLSISEIYVVYDGFAPQRGEVPFLMFDSVVVNRFRAHSAALSNTTVTAPDPDTPEQSEDEEYADLTEQLTALRRDHPSLPATAPEGIGHLVSRDMVTCDNSQFFSLRKGNPIDRRGVMVSVPVYDAATRAFKGLVTTVVRLNVLEARLIDWPIVPVTEEERAQFRHKGLDSISPANFVLVNAATGLHVMDRRNTALAEIVAGRGASRIKVAVPLTGPAGSGWSLEGHVPAHALDTIDAQSRHTLQSRTVFNAVTVLALACVSYLLLEAAALACAPAVRGRRTARPPSVDAGRRG